MPQVYFDANLHRGRVVDDDYAELVREHEGGFNWLRYIDNVYTIERVPGFHEAAVEGFEGWHLHHVMGETVGHRQLVKLGLYYDRPWHELRFMRIEDHRKIHSSPTFRAMYYGLVKM